MPKDWVGATKGATTQLFYWQNTHKKAFLWVYWKITWIRCSTLKLELGEAGKALALGKYKGMPKSWAININHILINIFKKSKLEEKIHDEQNTKILHKNSVRNRAVWIHIGARGKRENVRFHRPPRKYLLIVKFSSWIRFWKHYWLFCFH